MNYEFRKQIAAQMLDGRRSQPTQEEAISIARNSYAQHLTAQPSYAISRRLTEYAQALPSVRREKDQLNVISFIDQMILERKRAEREQGIPYQRISILDIGYGNGQDLLDAKNRWGDDVILVGFGPSFLTDIDGYDRQFNRRIHPTREALRESNVELVEGNVIDISEQLSGRQFDVIMSCNALQYSDYLLWPELTNIYSMLKPTGYAFLAIAPEQIFADMQGSAEGLMQSVIYKLLQELHQVSAGSIKNLEAHLQQKGYEFSIDERQGYILMHKNDQPALPSDIESVWPSFGLMKSFDEAVRIYRISPIELLKELYRIYESGVAPLFKLPA